MKPILVAVTGASGSPYALAFLRLLQKIEVPAEVILSKTAKEVFSLETGESPEILKQLAARCYEEDEIAAPPASGSARYQAMVIIPCTMGTLAAVAQGLAKNLITRAADVTLKERRPLVLVVRETPFNLIHLRNLLQAAQAGATIYPAMPAFYHRPQTIEDLISFFVLRLAEFLGLSVPELKRWEGLEGKDVA